MIAELPMASKWESIAVQCDIITASFEKETSGVATLANVDTQRSNKRIATLCTFFEWTPGRR